jgi:probable F420-dependent oxidoreductase
VSEHDRTSGRELALRLGPVGLWSPHLQWQPATKAREAVAEFEELGFGAVWVGEATGKEVLAHASILLPATERIVIATGIASIWARDPMAMANASRTLGEAYPGRFVLGLGVSHRFLTEPRQRRYEKPLAELRDYLEAMDGAPYVGPPVESPPRVLAALGPKMLELARDRTHGAHPYFVPVAHTAQAREILGPGPLLAPEQAAVLERDPDTARKLARPYMASYLALTSYARNLVRLGWSDADLAEGGSDRLTDALVAWGDVEDVIERVREHLAAGADHVAIRVLTEDPKRLPLAEVRELSAALSEVRRA